MVYIFVFVSSHRNLFGVPYHDAGLDDALARAAPRPSASHRVHLGQCRYVLFFSLFFFPVLKLLGEPNRLPVVQTFVGDAVT